MNKIMIAALLAFGLAGCVSTAQYKRDMASLNESIKVQNKNNAAMADFAEASAGAVKDFHDKMDEANINIGDLIFRVRKLEAFKLNHDKRWPPPVKLKGGK